MSIFLVNMTRPDFPFAYSQLSKFDCDHLTQNLWWKISLQVGYTSILEATPILGNRWLVIWCRSRTALFYASRHGNVAWRSASEAEYVTASQAGVQLCNKLCMCVLCWEVSVSGTHNVSDALTTSLPWPALRCMLRGNIWLALCHSRYSMLVW